MNLTLIPNAVSLRNGVPTTTSLKVAEVFGKTHDCILWTIKNFSSMAHEFYCFNFAPCVSKDEKDGTREFYCIAKDGFSLLAAEFTGSRVMKLKVEYIEAFNKMEREISKPKITPELGALAQTISALSAQLVKMIPAVPSSLAEAPEWSPPTPAMVDAYCQEQGYPLIGDEFCEFYGRHDWRSARGIINNFRTICDAWVLNRHQWEPKKEENHPPQIQIKHPVTKGEKRRVALSAWNLYHVSQLRKAARLLVPETRGVGGLAHTGSKEALIETLAMSGITPSRVQRTLRLNLRKAA